MNDTSRMDGGYRVALNPIQWFATADGWLNPNSGPAPREIMSEVARSGFKAIHAQVPPDWTVPQYKDALDQAGLQPAPGYFSLGLPDHGVSVDVACENARKSAAQHAALGLTDMFMSPRMNPLRVERPGIGASIASSEFSEVVSILDKVSAVIREEGVLAAFHPHVGCWGETESEARQILDAISASQLAFGPDTGHLSWAGADVVGLVRDYRDRVTVMHIKDCRLSVRDAAKAAGKTYRETVVDGLWAEPGLGELDLVAMIGAVGPDFDGWLIAEVDFPTMSPFASAEASARWLSGLKKPIVS
ncbi:hypothetical protein ASD83_06330 [Devosia sp. Root685]|uniref:sugar phosphate isomerase/epimerase family protein n=1 Tax=Devosia sp. Root685 TaxID=1736587 RepID=UPI0006F742E9|nr:sugar phosphate isomerase/epimerase [Devosia sp. Root685]KRB01140.1 hypothetical protein ASD83_06330 [Devosia sp. Root685]